MYFYTIYKTGFFIVPNHCPSRLEKNEQKIPRNICVVYHENKLSELLKPNIDSLIEKNPEYSFSFYNESNSRNFISRYFGERYARAYDKVIPGAYKADFFRYCYIYINGGVYIDINKKLLVPLDNIIKPETELFLVVDRPKCCIYQAFLASIPRHPLFKMCIDKCVENIETNYYGEDSLDPTGPRMMGRVFYELYGECLQLGQNDKNIEIATFNGSYVIYNDKKIIDSYMVNRLILNNIWKSQTNKKHYGDHWHEKTVYV